mgnify:CR=1 FL=1
MGFQAAFWVFGRHQRQPENRGNAVSGCLFCLYFLGAFLPVFGFGFALVFGQVGQAVGAKLVILGKALCSFAAALLGLGGNGGKVLRRKVKILRRGGGGVGLVVFCQLGQMRRQGFARLRGLVGKIGRLVFVVIVVLLPGLLQQGFAVGLFGLVGGVAGGHGGRLVDVWIGIGAGGEQDKGCD